MPTPSAIRSRWRSRRTACCALSGRRAEERAGPCRPPACAAALFFLLSFVPAAAAQQAWELAPYRVSLLVAFEKTPELDEALRRETMGALARRIDGIFGAQWTADVRRAPESWRVALLADIDALDRRIVETGDPLPDKIIGLAITSDPGGLRVAAREFDGHILQWRKPARARVFQPALLTEIAVRTVLEAFGPLGRLRFDDPQRVSLHLRASALPSGDPAFAQIRVGDVLQPFVGRRRRGPSTDRSDFRKIPWTYLVVERAEPPLLVCRVMSGLRHPFGLRRRGRLEYLALPIRTAPIPLLLELQSRNHPDFPLAGYDVLARNEATAEFEPLGRTDWRGRITIPPAPPGREDAGQGGQQRPTTEPVRMLEIRSSGETLARFPVAVGFQPRLVVRLADDPIRVQVQGFLLEIEDRLIDTVARRQILMARIARRLEAGAIDQAARSLDQLKQLPDRQQLLSEIRRQERISHSQDPLVQARIEQSFEQTKNLLARFLDPRPINRLQSQYDRAERERRARRPR